MKHIDISPIDNSELTPFLSCKDYTVSKEEFSILSDNSNDLLVTSPRPNDKNLSSYYESESYISHTDSKKSIFDRIYQLVRSYALKQKLKLVNSFETESKSILDIGAGTGDFLLTCQKDGWNVCGIEPNNKASGIAEKKLGNNLKSVISDVKSQRFDVITMWHVLEHVPDLNDTFIQVKQLLKAKGILIIAVPNHKSNDAHYYGKYWAAYDVPRHLWHFSQKAIHKLANKHAMSVIKTLPMKFDAYYVSLLSEKYKTGKLRPLKAFLRGMHSNFKARSTKEYSSLIYIIKNT